jgi:hypothetical protein
MRPNSVSKQIATAGAAVGLVALMAFANLASGAGRIVSTRPRGKIAVVGTKLTSARSLAAGDRVQRVLEVRTGGRMRVTLLVTAKAASPLTDRSVGLRLRVDSCAMGWRRGAGGSYTCRGKTTVAAAEAPALGRHVLRKLRKRRKNHLRLTLTLPQSAPNALQGQIVELVYKLKR